MLFFKTNKQKVELGLYSKLKHLKKKNRTGGVVLERQRGVCVCVFSAKILREQESSPFNQASSKIY